MIILKRSFDRINWYDLRIRSFRRSNHSIQWLHTLFNLFFLIMHMISLNKNESRKNSKKNDSSIFTWKFQSINTLYQKIKRTTQLISPSLSTRIIWPKELHIHTRENNHTKDIWQNFWFHEPILSDRDFPFYQKILSKRDSQCHFSWESFPFSLTLHIQNSWEFKKINWSHDIKKYTWQFFKTFSHKRRSFFFSNFEDHFLGEKWNHLSHFSKTWKFSESKDQSLLISKKKFEKKNSNSSRNSRISSIINKLSIFPSSYGRIVLYENHMNSFSFSKNFIFKVWNTQNITFLTYKNEITRLCHFIWISSYVITWWSERMISNDSKRKKNSELIFNSERIWDQVSEKFFRRRQLQEFFVTLFQIVTTLNIS